jgi:hypothetical protein
MAATDRSQTQGEEHMTEEDEEFNRIERESKMRTEAVRYAISIKQGHHYSLSGSPVIALDTGTQARVMHFNPDEPWHGLVEVVDASQLVPEPMKYFRGEVPK